MNILAHYLLSQRNKEIIVGNFVADFIKNGNTENFPIGILNGIALHRKIDDFSDHHSEVKKTWSLLNKDFGHYGRVITDIYYDHFLCLHWNEYSDYSLDDDIEHLYAAVQSYMHLFPSEVHRKVSRSIEKRWLYKYSDMDGLREVFLGMSRRAKFANRFEFAVDVLEKNHKIIDTHFSSFFPDLKKYVSDIFGDYA